MTPPCARLRWKGRGADGPLDPLELHVRLLESPVPFTCLDTCQAWGPDDGPATPERCDPARACYRAPGGPQA